MTLGDAERSALVAHLSTRFPSWGARADIARDAGLGDVQLTGPAREAWSMLVGEAEQRGMIVDLLRVAARGRPTDAELMAMHASAARGELVVPPAEDPSAWMRGAALAGGVVLLLGVLALIGDLSGASSFLAPRAPIGGPAELNEVATDPSTPTPSEGEGMPAVEPEPGAAAPSELEPESEPTEAEDSSVDPPAGAAVAEGPCATPRGRVIGYAYAGSSSPGQAGETWVLPRSLNVRVDYPRQENGWSSKARVACVLGKGAKLRMVEAPIPVGGGVFWVPVVGGEARAR